MGNMPGPRLRLLLVAAATIVAGSAASAERRFDGHDRIIYACAPDAAIPLTADLCRAVTADVKRRAKAAGLAVTEETEETGSADDAPAGAIRLTIRFDGFTSIDARIGIDLQSTTTVETPTTDGTAPRRRKVNFLMTGGDAPAADEGTINEVIAQVVAHFFAYGEGLF